ncbi:MAG: hypothetical protein WBV22_08435 [Anaerolineaceae bacterium]
MKDMLGLYIETTNVINALIEYQKSIETDIKENTPRKIAKYEEKLLNDGIDFTKNGLIQYEWTYSYFFPLIMRYSYISLLWTALENRLNSYCSFIHKEYKPIFFVNNIKGGYLERTKDYFKQIDNYKRVEWTFIQHLYIVRNCIVHSFGKIDLLTDNKQILINIIKSKIYTGLTSTENEGSITLIVSPEYCVKAIGEVNDFFRSLFNASNDLIKI